MKKRVLIFCVVAITSIPLFASGLKILNHYALPQAGEIKAYHPVVSTDGKKLLYSAEDYKGLYMLNLENGESVEISQETGVGYMPIFSGDGNTVYYKRVSTANRLRTSNIESYDLIAKNRKEIAPQSRENLQIIPQKEGVLLKVGTKFIGRKQASTVIAYSDRDKILVNVNGVEKAISPLKDAHSYLWISVSPNGKKILFVEPYLGVFVCNIDGSNPSNLGKGDAPVWCGDDYVIASRSKDDGYVVLSAQLYAINVSNSSAIALTTSDMIVEEATVSFNTGKIIYATIDGKLNVIEVKID